MNTRGLMARRSPTPDPWIVPRAGGVVVVYRSGDLWHTVERGPGDYLVGLGFVEWTLESIRYRADRAGD